MRGSQRIFFAALALSLLVHLFAAGSSGRWFTAPASEIPFPIEAHLDMAAVPVAVPDVASGVTSASTPATRQSIPQASSPPAAEIPASEPVPEPAPSPLPLAPVEPPAPMLEPSAPKPEPVQPVAVAPQSAPDATVSPHVARNLPERIALRYSVQSGEDGFTIGQTTYSGQIRDGRYSLVSVTEATGITALFVSGKIIQTSEGRVTASGLQPEQFWSAKGEKRQPPVRFDWAQQRLLLPGGGVDLPPQTQDLMSFPFHLALMVREGDVEWTLPVTNGKKLREYRFQIVGRETLTAGDLRVETFHLQGGRMSEGSLDVWLAPARNWLPLRSRMLDQKGKVIVLTLQDPVS
jgi:hypothetical protein